LNASLKPHKISVKVVKMQDYSFYKYHLEQVSRSFAFCIDSLEEPLKTPVAHMYLTCRVLDTLEDSSWLSLKMQIDSFNIFLDLFENMDEIKYENWQKNLPTDLPQGELELLTEADKLILDYQKFSPEIQTILYDLYETMATGMMAFQSRTSQQGLKINHHTELNEYCYYVAGIVGLALTRLNAELFKCFQPDEEVMKNALHFGLFLQKINFVKGSARG
jgi:phytoene/squalene synthetase